ncbi:MAG: YjbE family putative metal transport protein [Notoacmeibacter sp.]
MLENIWPLLQIIFADIVLSGDNALVIGMAAAGLAPADRQKAIFLGMALAAGLRIVFAIIATYLLGIPGLLFAGGLLLVWVCWRFYGDLKDHMSKGIDGTVGPDEKGAKEGNTLWKALVTITIADVSMSIDNVLAVAGIARDNTSLLIFGLGLAIVFMAFFATIIMKVMVKFAWLSWLGLVFLIYISGKMLYDGWPEVAALLAPYIG